MAKHTAGPWSRNIKPASKYPVVFAGRNTHIARVYSEGLSEDEVEANITLITASPFLLAALEVIRDQLELLPDAHIGNKIVHFALTQAVNAIAEAKGE